MSYIQQFFTSRDNNANAETFVGQEGRLWWDPTTNQIYSSDGETPGGIPLAGGGGGGSPGGSNSQVQFNNSGTFGGSANLTFNRVSGALTAVSFVGDGSALSNIAGANVVGAVSNATYASSATNAINAETVTANSQPNITGVGILSTLSVSGNVDAAYFIGNGSQLTGIAGSSGNRIFNGTSNVEIATADGNVTITTAGTSTWAFDTAGTLNLPGGNIVQAVDNDLNIVVQDADNDDFALQTIVDDGAGTTLSRIRQRRGDIQLGTGLATGSPHYWQFDSSGTLRLAGDVWGNAGGNLTVQIPISGADSFISLQTRDNTDTIKSNINVTTTNVTISTNTAGNTWVFDNAGSLMLPGNLGANNAGITSINDGQIVNLKGQANGIVGIKAYGSAANLVAGVAFSGDDAEVNRVTVSVFNPVIDDNEYWSFNTAGDFTTGTGNIFFSTDVGGPVIVPGGTGVKIAADRSDLTTSYVNITNSGITIDAIGGSTADITLRAADDIILRGGDKTSAPGQRGGDINIEAGQGGPDNGIDAGDGGDVNIIGGFGGEALAGGPGHGGDAALVGGPGSTANVTNSISAGRGGAAVIQGGDGGQNADTVNLSAQGGNVEIYGGLGSFDSANGVPSGAPGHVNIYGGNWGWIANSGNITLNTYQPTTFYTWTYNNLGQTIFPTLDTARGDTTGGTITGSTIRIGDGSQQAVITTPDGDAITQDSPRLVINPGKGADLTAGEGGDIYLWAGRGGSGDGANAVSGGSGGDIKIRGGQGGGVNGAGGYIRMEAGDGAYGSPGDSGAAGFIEITGGSSGADRNGGYVRILAGQGSFSGGDANITGGVGQAGPGGPVNITGGTSGNGLAEYGNVNITSGASTWVFDNTGKLTVPGEGYIRAIGDTISLISYDLANSLGYGLRVGTTGALYLEQGSDPAYLTLNPNAGNAEIYSASGTSGGAGKNLSITAGAADQTNYFTTPGGNVNISGGLGAFNDGGGGGPGGSVNISAGNSSDPAGVPGNVTINSGINTWTFDYNGTLNLPEGTAYIGSAANALTLHANDSEAIYISAISGGISAETNGNVTLISNVDGVTNYAWTFDNTGNLTAPGIIAANTFVSNEYNVLTAGNLSITSQYGLGVTGTILENGGTLELIGNGTGAGTTGCVVVGWNSSYGTAGNVAQMYFNPADSTGNIVVTTGNTAATNYQWNFDKTGKLSTPGAISVAGNAVITYTPATTVGYGITVNAANTQGGTGYADFLRATNTSGGATNPNKSFRLSSAGALEIINSAYSATLLSLSDAGALSVPVAYQVSGKQAVNGPAFSAYAAAILQNIPNGAQTKVLFQTEEFDTNNNYANSRFTPTVEGYYQLNAEVRIDGASGTGEMMIILYKNGAEYKRGTNQSGTQIASSFWAMQVSSVAYANGSTDYFEIYVQQGSGGTLSVTAVNAPAITWFNGCMLRGA